MLDKKFGIEVEFTGITRKRAAQITAEYLGVNLHAPADDYHTLVVSANDGRLWKLTHDASIKAQRKAGRNIISANENYQAELVSPILTYKEDIETVQELVRLIRKAGGFTNDTCGVHVHLDGADHSPRSIRNFINIIASKNDLLYKALQIPPERMRYCKKMDSFLVERMNRSKPRTFQKIESIWYEGYRENRSNRYHDSRYFFLNLHSFFNGHRTVELRGFNAGRSGGNLHAGVIRAYVVLALALNNQALTQQFASPRKVQEENEKFAMRTYLNRLGLIGDEYKSCREHLCKHLSGNGAWRYRQ